MFLNTPKILSCIKVNVKNYTKVFFFYIIDNLKGKIQCLNNTTNNNFRISESRDYKNTCQEPIYNIIYIIYNAL